MAASQQEGIKPGLPEDPILFEYGGWEGIDTQPSRAGVDDKHAAWMDNIMPIGNNNARAMPDLALAPLYVAPAPLVIIWHAWFVLTNTGSCAIVFLSDGSAVEVAKSNGLVTNIAPAGTFSPTNGTLPYAFQFGAQYLVIVSEQTNGYWLWDGLNLYGAGTIAPVVNLTNGGQNYTSPPTVTFVTGGGGTGASFTATISAGSVNGVQVVNPGHGFVLNENPILLFSGGGGGTTAYGSLSTSNGVISNAAIVNGGSGFTGVPGVVITDSTGTGAVIVVNAVSGGILTGLKVLSGGANYTSPSISFSGGGGSGATASAQVANGVITNSNLIQAGSGYAGVPTVTAVPATAAIPGTGASLLAVMNTNGTVQGITIVNGGSGYTGTLYAVFTGGQGPASATLQLMPFGIQGSTGDVNGGRVWIASIVSPVKVFFTAAGVQAPQDFLPSDGAGAFPPNNSHLQYQYTALKSSSGEFLYLIGDSSVDYESGATTSGTPPTTTFAKLNVDEQIGTVWRDTVINYGRAIMLANSFGIHTIYGGAVQKVSSPLDGFYSTGSVTNVVPSSAVAEVYGIHIYMLLKPVIDPFTGLPRNILIFWDGKRWWTGSQSLTLNQISTREYASVIEAWGTDGVSLFQLFTNPSTILPKTLASKLWVKPSIMVQKRSLMFYALYQANGPTTLNFSIDTESISVPVTKGAFTGTSGLTWARSGTPTLVGHAMGYRMTSNSPDFTLVDMTLLGQEYRTEY